MLNNPKTVKVVLNINEDIVKYIESVTNEKFEKLLEEEINLDNGKVFIEAMNYDC